MIKDMDVCNKFSQSWEKIHESKERLHCNENCDEDRYQYML